MFYKLGWVAVVGTGTLTPALAAKLVRQAFDKYSEEAPVNDPPALVVVCIKTFPPSFNSFVEVKRLPVVVHKPVPVAKLESGQILRVSRKGAPASSVPNAKPNFATVVVAKIASWVIVLVPVLPSPYPYHSAPNLSEVAKVWEP